jgi:hypothetical protein
MRLIRVKKSGQGVQCMFHVTRRHTYALTPSEFKTGENDAPLEEVAEFLVVTDDNDVPAVVAELAMKNPGRDVQVFALESESVCPPAALVKKEVTRDGILPVFPE